MKDFEATTQIRNLKHDKAKVPIFAITANIMKEEVEKCMYIGRNEYVSKPFETKNLLMKIEQLLRNVK
jgi:CheY-like chemotaxis protein